MNKPGYSAAETTQFPKSGHSIVNVDVSPSPPAAVHQDVSHALGGQAASECSGPQDGQRQTAGKEHAALSY